MAQSSSIGANIQRQIGLIQENDGFKMQLAEAQVKSKEVDIAINEMQTQAEMKRQLIVEANKQMLASTTKSFSVTVG